MSSKRTSTPSTSAAANGGTPNKKAKVNVSEIFASSDDDDDQKLPQTATATINAISVVHLPMSKNDVAEFNETLLRTLESAASARDKFQNFDFSKLHVPEYTKDEIRAHYDQLRAAALKNVRHLTLKGEIELIRKYTKLDMIRVGESLKKPRSSYLLFAEDAREKILRKHPELKSNMTAMSSLIAERWQKLDPEKKQRYEERAKELRDEFYGQHPEMRPGKAKRKSGARPKPKSGYLLFLDDARGKLLNKHPELKSKAAETFKILGEQWKNLDAEKKQKYEDRAKATAKEFYEQHPELKPKSKRNPKAKNHEATTAKSRIPPPKSAFDLFSESKHDEYAEKYELKGEELLQKLAIKYAKLSDKKRGKWENRAKEAMDQYIEALSQERSQKIDEETPKTSKSGTLDDWLR